jgi:hypothetical protein
MYIQSSIITKCMHLFARMRIYFIRTLTFKYSCCHGNVNAKIRFQIHIFIAISFFLIC